MFNKRLSEVAAVDAGRRLNPVGRKTAVWPVGAALLLALLIAAAIRPQAVYAATINVDDGVVAYVDDGQCSLTEAIVNANIDAQQFASPGECEAGAVGADTIVLPVDGQFTFTSAFVNYGGDTALSVVASEIIIEGNGSTIERSGAAPGFRIFAVSSGGNLTINDTTVRNGRVLAGGAVFNDTGTLTVNGSTLSGNSTTTGGGGAIYNFGTVNIVNSTLSGNTSNDSGGALASNTGSVTIVNSTFTGNSVAVGEGGAIIMATGSVTLINNVIAGNSAASGAGEIVRYGGTINADAYNVFGHSGLTNAQAFTGFTPGANDLTATSDGTNPTALADILDTTLADNGGPTPTHALTYGSPAIDFAPTADCAADPVFGTDQRGELRSVDIPGTGNDGGASLCDAGAFEAKLLPPVSYCPVDPNVGTLRTDLIGTGQGSPTKGFRTRKLVVPNSDEVVALYGQLAAVDVGTMKYVRFLPQGNPKVQIHAPTSMAYRAYAVDWWGTDLPTDVQWVKGQFFWGAKANKAPRAFVLWPTYETTGEYANVFTTFDESSENHVAAEAGWYSEQTHVLSIPETQADGATVVVRLAIVDNNKDTRPVWLSVTVGSQSQGNEDTAPNARDTLNLYEFTFESVPAGVDEITIHLESPPPGELALLGGDSAAMIGAAVSYACNIPVR